MEEAVEQHRQALRRIVMALAVMVDCAVLPRRLHRTLLRVLRPAEAAARRLIIALAMHMAADLFSAQQNPPPKTPTRRARHFLPKMPVRRKSRKLTRLTLPLCDRFSAPFARRPRRVRDAPRISVPGHTARAPARLPLTPDDPIESARLGLRLDALLRALGDLPGQALRFRRWRARLSAAAPTSGRRRRPLRPGPPPGARSKPRHAVHEVLGHAHELAWWALERPS